MRMIPKMQRGGISSAVFAAYTPIPKPQAQQAAPASAGAASARSASTRSSGGLDEKDFLSLLKGVEALPSDLMALQKGITDIWAASTVFSSDPDFGNMGPMMAELQTNIQIAKFNKEEYNKAYNNVLKNEGLNESAVDSSGNVYVYTKDKKLTSVSIPEYLKHKSDYSAPLTNSNLLWLRAHDPQFTGNNQVLDIVSNGIGMKEIVKQINSNLRSLGSSTEELSGYVKKTNGQVSSGIEALQKLADSGQKAAVDGIYKVKSKNVNSQKQMEAAISAIYQSLTPNAQKYLMLQGGDHKNPLKGAYNLISQKVMSIMNNTISYDETYQDDFTPDGTPIPKGKSGSGSTDDLKQNIPMQFLQGIGYTEMVNINPGGNLDTQVQAVSQITPGSDNRPFEGQYLEELETSGMGGVLDIRNASMGGYKVAMPDQVRLTDRTMHLVWWPANDDGTPDLSAGNLDAIKAANEEIRNAGLEASDPRVADIFQKHGIANYQNLQQFVLYNAMTNNKALGIDRFDSTPLLEEVDSDMSDKYESDYENYWSKDKQHTKTLDFDHFDWYNPNDWFGGYDSVYKGVVWIPVHNHFANAMAGTGERMETGQLQDYQQRQFETDENIRAQKQYVNPNEYE